MSNNFAVFILSHKRAHDVKTVKLLQKQHYTGDFFVVIDDEDDQIEDYKELFGDRLVIFNKREIQAKMDTGDNDYDNIGVGVFARNAIQDIAREKGYKYHMQLDDDFSSIVIRYQDKKSLKSKKVKNLDKMFNSFVEFLQNTGACWLSLSLSSYYLGGPNGKNFKKGLIPKTMGSFCMNDEYKPFCMRFNDDITTTLLNWEKGLPCFSVMALQVGTPPTQHQSGGMTQAYKDNGTYRKSFYSVMCCPSFAKISTQGIVHQRIHHDVRWENCCPKILNEKWKKQTS